MVEETDEFETIAERTHARRKPIEALDAYMPDESPAKGEDAVEVEVTPEEQSIEVAVEPKPNKSVKAERYLELIAAGEPEYLAARHVGSTVRDMTANPDMKAAVKKLIDQGTLPALVRKAMYRAGIDTIFMENIQTKKGHKTALAAAKIAVSDPEIGLTAPPQGASVNIDVTELGPLLAKLVPIKGLESIINEEKEVLEGDIYGLEKH